MKSIGSYKSVAFAAFGYLCSASSIAVPRDIQITSIDFDTGVVELRNLGASTEALDGWRFCSHNTSLVRRYSSGAGLNGISLAPDQSLFIHYNNDAALSNEINISTVGGGFAALERDAYGLQIYFTPVSFGNGNTIADHLQWSLGGIDNTTADERSDEAEVGGVWVNQGQWISVQSDTDKIRLTDLSAGVLHSPANYALGEPQPPVQPVVIPTLPIAYLALCSAALGWVAWRRLKVR